MTDRDIIRTIRNIEKDCKEETIKEGTRGNWEHQKDKQINYERFYHRVMGVIELADEATRPRGGGICG